MIDPKTLPECCKRAKAYNQEHEYADDYVSIGVSILLTVEHHRMILKEFDDLNDAAKDKNWGKYLLGLADVLYLACNLTQEAGLETVLSAAFSLQHRHQGVGTPSAERSRGVASDLKGQAQTRQHDNQKLQAMGATMSMTS